MLVFLSYKFPILQSLGSAYKYWDISHHGCALCQSSKLYINKRGEGFFSFPSYKIISSFTGNYTTHAENMPPCIITQWFPPCFRNSLQFSFTVPPIPRLASLFLEYALVLGLTVTNILQPKWKNANSEPGVKRSCTLLIGFLEPCCACDPVYKFKSLLESFYK